ncbi:MAG: DUF1559 domain-containing protein [Planctomycetes bacterium]|nr:DUF1559 domain-containing protein [Planctomycetota bacterium]
MLKRKAFTRNELIVVLAIIGSLAAIIVPAILKAREAARAGSCVGNMNQIQLALILYQDFHGNFPAAFQVGADGQPWHSWRVQVLPFLETQKIYDQYLFSEPWNGPNNRLLADKIRLEMFQCPSGADRGRTQMTNYGIIQGANTIFPGKATTKLEDISDGPENTILLVETHDGDIHWMEPRDVNATSTSVPLNGSSKASISSPHPAGPGVCFADRIRVYRLPPSFTSTILFKLSTTQGEEFLTRELVLPR